jgi:type 1 glutamine amidotransferase
VIFLTEGAKWVSADEKRLAAFRRLAARGGGLACLHWGMGTREAGPVEAFVNLFGGCHGGPDRKHKVIEKVTVTVPDPTHPVAAGVKPLTVREEFYYRLKLAKTGRLAPVLQATIDGEKETVAWAWERPDGGRSFGFSGLHFHDNWKHPTYRRVVAQGVLWAAQVPVPAGGLSVDLAEADLRLPVGK